MSFDQQTCTPTVDGLHYIQWIHSLFGECVYGWQECLSLLLGYISIFCWLNAQMPQVIKNYRLGTAESLSFTFLTVWLIGDVANFVGCILTGQMDFQIYLSIYFIGIDTLLCIQWLYYVKYPDNWLRRCLNPECDSPKIPTTTPTTKETQVIDESSLLLLHEQDSYQSTSASSTTAKTLLAFGFLATLGGVTTPSAGLTSQDVYVDESWDRNLWIGRVSAWVCTGLYLSSRIPQILRNFKRHSVEGLAIALFLCAAGGNLTYTLSIFTNPHQTRESLLEAVPYILGSAGTLMFDLTIFLQYLFYNHQSTKSAQDVCI
ncbi:hypothetical protein VTP01DRAFT_3242 [Rhizomucor pusillus]|uniref:uncharacterized protein n=1 Tax=Rhizomucor pusillus TaxID=4840 RepID=UPI003742579B